MLMVSRITHVNPMHTTHALLDKGFSPLPHSALDSRALPPHLNAASPAQPCSLITATTTTLIDDSDLLIELVFTSAPHDNLNPRGCAPCSDTDTHHFMLEPWILTDNANYI